MRKLAVLMGLILATTLVAQDATKGKPKIEGHSLSVYRNLDAKKFMSGSSAQTMIQLVVTYPDKQLLRVDAESKVNEFKDDKGTSLLVTGFFSKPTFSGGGNVSKDRQSIVVAVQTFAAPARGATKVTVKGDLVLISGLDEKSTEEKEIAIKNMATEKVGDFTIKCEQEKGFGSYGPGFSIASPKALKSVAVKDEDGKEVEVAFFNTYHSPFSKGWSSSFTLKKQPKKAKITIKYFSKEEKTTVPVDITVGVGL